MRYQISSYIIKPGLIFILNLVVFFLSGCHWISGNIQTDLVSTGPTSYCLADRLTNVPFAGGSGTSSDPFLICTAQQWNAIGSSNSYLSLTFKLMDNIDLSSFTISTFQVVGSSTNPFTGVLEGNGKIISGLNISNATSDFALFGFAANGATFKNLTLTTFNIVSSAGSAAALVSNISTGTVTIENVNVNSSSITIGELMGLESAGALVGTSSSPAILNVSNSSSTNNTIGCPACGGQHYMGGMVGFADNATFNSSSSSNLTISNTGAGSHGGLIGRAFNLAISNSSASNLTFDGVGETGGLVGRVVTSASITSSSVTGGILLTGPSGGGLVGSQTNGSTLLISNSFAAVDVTCTTACGGLVGLYGNGINISRSYYSGTITTTSGNSLGGLLGNMSGATGRTFTITDSYVRATISPFAGSSRVGGIVGFMNTTNTFNVSRVYFAGTIPNAASRGCFMGATTGVTINSNDNLAAVVRADYLSSFQPIVGYGGNMFFGGWWGLAATAPNSNCRNNRGSFFSIFTFSDCGSSNAPAMSNVVADGSPRIVVMTRTGSADEIYINGRLVGNYGSIGTAITENSGFQIGRDLSGSFGAADIGDVMGFNAALSTSQREDIECYLSGKYSIKVNNSLGCGGPPVVFDYPSNMLAVKTSSSTTLTTVGGVTPYTYSIVSGAGSVSSAGVFTASSASATTVVKVTDAFQNSNTLTIETRGYPQPKAWYRTSDITGVADGGSITRWIDVSGNGNDVAPLAGITQPVYRASIINSLPVARFVAGATLRSNIMFNPSTPWEVYVVTRGGTTGRPFSYGIQYNCNDSILLEVNSGGFFAGGFNCNGVVGTVATTTSPTLFAVTHSTSNIDVRINGSSANTGVVVMNGATFTATPQFDGAFQIGNSFNGDVAEVVFFDVTLTAGERTALESELRTKYGLP